MRILHFTSPNVADSIPIYHPLSLAGHHVAVMHGRELQVYDLDRPTIPIVRIQGAVEHALVPSALVVADTKGMLHRWETREEGVPSRWESAGALSLPDTAGAVSHLPTHLRMSSSGRYVLVE